MRDCEVRLDGAFGVFGESPANSVPLLDDACSALVGVPGVILRGESDKNFAASANASQLVQ